MKIEDIKELVAVLEQSSLNYLEVTKGEFRLKLGKTAPAEAPAAISASGAVPGAAAPKAAAPAETAASVKSEAVAPAVQTAVPTGGVPVKSPMVGVFYAASSPEAEPFVVVGQAVKKGQVLCIIEAMKLMNEITAEKDGVITEVCVANGDIVEFGQPLFYIQ